MQRTGRHDHTQLHVFELDDESALLVEGLTARFPREELRKCLTTHMRRAAISILSHAVNGCARDSQAYYFFFIAFGSLRELHYQIRVFKRLDFMLTDDVSLIEPTIIETEKVLNGLIQSWRIG